MQCLWKTGRDKGTHGLIIETLTVKSLLGIFSGGAGLAGTIDSEGFAIVNDGNCLVVYTEGPLIVSVETGRCP